MSTAQPSLAVPTAHPLAGWFLRQERIEAQSPYLEDVLVSERLGAYGWHRIRFFLLRFLLDQLIHIIEFGMLAYIFSPIVFVSVLLFKSAATLLHSWWWGALEVLRERIRDLHSEKKFFMVLREISPWLSAALILAAVCLIGAAGFLLYVSTDTGIQVVHAYLFAVLAGVALGFPTQTFHSGMYAVRRIYRPVWAIVGVDVCCFALIVLIWPVLREWAVPLMMFIRAIVANGLTVYLVWRGFEARGLTPITFAPFRESLQVFRRLISSEGLLAGLAAIAARTEVLLVLFFVHALTAMNMSHQDVLLLYLLSPSLRASHDWAGLFYFDFKRLGLAWLESGRRLFQRLIFRLSLLMGLGLWACAWLVLIAFGWLQSAKQVFLLGPVFVASALVSFMQMSAFSERRFIDVVVSGAMLSMGVWIVYQLPHIAVLQVLFFCSLLIFTVALIQRQPFGVLGRPERCAVWPPTLYLDKLLKEKGTLALGEVRLWRSIDDAQSAALARSLARRLGPLGVVSIYPGRRILWYSHMPKAELPEWIMLEAAGLIESIRTAESSPAQQQTLKILSAWGAIPDGNTHGQFAGDNTETVAQSVVRKFSSTFNRGWCLERGELRHSSIGAFSPQERRWLISAALGYAEKLQPVRTQLPYEISALLIEGECAIIFGVPKNEPLRVRQSWHRQLRYTNLQLVIGATTPTRLAGQSGITPSKATMLNRAGDKR